MGLEIRALAVGPLAVNCYLVWDSDSRHGVVIDPGSDAEDIAEAIARLRLTPVAVLLTHGHVDHIGAVGSLCSRYGVPVYLHPADRALYFSPANAVPPWIPPTRDLPEPLGELPVGPGPRPAVLPTPGHTPGSVCFHFAEAGVLFAGDTLFAGGVGRTDLPGGSAAELERSIRTQLYSLPPETRVYPGHGDATTTGTERRTNPFVRP